MTRSALTLIQIAFVRAACAHRTERDLRVLRGSVEYAGSLPPGEPWPARAAAHAEFHCLLADATGTPGFAVLARFIHRSVQDLITAAGPAAENMIVESRHRLLGRLAAADADRAAQEMAGHLARLGQTAADYPELSC